MRESRSLRIYPADHPSDRQAVAQRVSRPRPRPPAGQNASTNGESRRIDPPGLSGRPPEPDVVRWTCPGR